MRKIKISEDAYLDIEEMFSYISQDNKTAAEKLRKKIFYFDKVINAALSANG